MRRNGPLRRRSPLVATKRLSPRSKRREEEAAERTIIRERVFARDRWTCRLVTLDASHRCGGPLTPHHVHKASQGGSYTEDNLVRLCAAGNTWVEDHPSEAHALGLVIRRGDNPERGTDDETD